MDAKTIARFWSRVDRGAPDECWTWRGFLNRSGYGIFSVQGRATLVHRFSWELANGRRIRAGGQVLHKCDNKQCLNPAHLRVGSASANRLDWFAKGCPPKTDKRHAPPRRPLTVEERFWAKVEKSGPPHPYDAKLGACWIWKAFTNHQRYGRFRFHGRDEMAHRVGFHLQHGRWPHPFGLHTCDNPPCCNPSHIIEGTLQDNVAQMMARDRQAKGPDVRRNRVGAKGDRNGMRTHPERNYMRRHPEMAPRGERHARSKLTDALVKQIMVLSAKGLSNQSIGLSVGVSAPTVSSIRLGHGWRHVTRVAEAPRQLRVGEQNHGARITEAIAREILRLDAKGVRNAEIARQLRLPAGLVCRVRLRQTWRHVTL